MKSVLIIGIILAVIVIGIFLLALTNPNLRENKETWFGFIDVNLEENMPIQEQKQSSFTSTPTKESTCFGNARCLTGTVTKVTDGDTINVDDQAIRFSLVSAPELNEFGGKEAKDFINGICPVGSTALVDEDDGQTEGSYGRIIGVIHCNGKNLNEELLDSGIGSLSSKFCKDSEFSTHSWTQKHGC